MRARESPGSGDNVYKVLFRMSQPESPSAPGSVPIQKTQPPPCPGQALYWDFQILIGNNWAPRFGT